MKARTLIDKFETFAPIEQALDGDPVGIQIGDFSSSTNRVLVTLDVRPEVVDEAIQRNCDFIFSHHPLIFRKIQNIDYSDPQSKMYADIIKHNIKVYSAHTNLDVAKDGMNDWLADSLGLTEIENVFNPSENASLGRVGVLSNPVSVKEFAKHLKELFKLDGLRVVSNNLDDMISKVGIIGGDGGKFYPDMICAGADVFITGDVYYHTGHDMLASNLNVIDVGHNVEKICIDKLTEKFEAWKVENNWDVEFEKSTVNTNPYTFM